MARNKQKKLDEVESLPNVFPMKEGNVEKKIKSYFGNDNPLMLEIGCGDADYSRSMAIEYPTFNYIGIDIRGARIWNASKKVEENDLKNVAFIIARAEFITEIFQEFKFQEIWIPFPDPFPRDRNEGRRLVAPSFIERYKRILKPDAIVNLKTDDDGLYEYGNEILAQQRNVEIVRNINNLYLENNLSFKEQIKTKYELKHLKDGKTIKLLSFKYS